MADPVLSVSLVTPISVMLTWDIAGDTEIWWKSDHPAGQEFAPLATVSGSSYLVENLSWTTTYTFKVRNVSGAVFGAFSNEIEIFICCGQAVIVGPGPPPFPPLMNDEYWQQAVDVDGDTVVFAALPYSGEGGSKTEAEMMFYSISSETWEHVATVDPDWLEQFFPINLQAGKVNMIAVPGSGDNYLMNVWNGSAFVSASWVLEEGYEFFADYEDSMFNDDGRIVATCYQGMSVEIPWASGTFDTDDPLVGYLSEVIGVGGPFTGHVFLRSDDAGVWPGLAYYEYAVLVGGVDGVYNPGTELWETDLSIGPLVYGHDYYVRLYFETSSPVFPDSYWSNELGIHTTVQYGGGTTTVTEFVAGYGCTMFVRISNDGGVTFGSSVELFDTFGAGYMGMAESVDGTIWFIVDDFTQDVSSHLLYRIYKYVVGSPVVLVKTITCSTDMVYSDTCKIVAEGSKIVAMYPYMDIGGSLEQFQLSISTNNGSTWTDKTFAPAGIDVYSGMNFQLCLSSGNIIVYFWDQDVVFHLMTSTDNGDSWSDKWDFTNYSDATLDIPWLRSDGNTVVYAGCRFSENGVNPLGFLLSRDAGVTWELIVSEPTATETIEILVPA